MKKIIAALAVATLAFSANAQVQKSLVKTFPINGAKNMSIDLKNAQVEIKTSDDDLVHVQTNINLKNGTEALYDQLAKSGRYNLSLSAANEPILTSSERSTVKVSGADLEEDVKYIVSVPKYITAQNVNAIAFGGKKGKGKATKKPAPVKKATSKTAVKPAPAKSK